MSHRESADPKIDLPSSHIQLDTAILGEAMFCNIKLGQNFDASQKLGLVFGSRRVAGLKDPINPISNLKIILKRLEVNIRGPLSDCLTQDQVEEADNRSISICFEKIIGFNLSLLRIIGQLIGREIGQKS